MIKWNYCSVGILISVIFTCISYGSLREEFDIPEQLSLTEIVKMPDESVCDNHKITGGTNGKPTKHLYYQNGKLLIIKTDYDSNGTIDAISFNDENNRLIGSMKDQNDDGKYDTVFFKLKDGNTFTARDRNYDSRYDIWDVNGNTKGQTIEDNNYDGIFDKNRHLINKRCIKEETDRDYDGKMDYEVRRDTQGRILYFKEAFCEERIDIILIEKNFDPRNPSGLLNEINILRDYESGKPFRWIEREYDPDKSYTIKKEKIATDTTGDGHPNETIVRIDNRIVSLDKDYNGDGVMDEVGRWKEDEITGDGSNRKHYFWMIEKDRNLDGKVDYWGWYLSGKIVAELKDDDFNGLPEIIEEPLKNSEIVEPKVAK